MRATNFSILFILAFYGQGLAQGVSLHSPATVSELYGGTAVVEEAEHPALGWCPGDIDHFPPALQFGSTIVLDEDEASAISPCGTATAKGVTYAVAEQQGLFSAASVTLNSSASAFTQTWARTAHIHSTATGNYVVHAPASQLEPGEVWVLRAEYLIYGYTAGDPTANLRIGNGELLNITFNSDGIQGTLLDEMGGIDIVNDTVPWSGQFSVVVEDEYEFDFVASVSYPTGSNAYPTSPYVENGDSMFGAAFVSLGAMAVVKWSP